jgi:hypothetical protein
LVVIFWYALVPIAGGFFNRYKWKKFRNQFNTLRLCPSLNYCQYRQLDSSGGIFRFSGGIESITDGHTLWVKGDDLTIPVSIAKTKCFLLPIHDGEGFPEAPQQIRWNRVSTITEGAKVFIAGCIKKQNDRLSFVSTKELDLMVIFYDCPDTDLASEIIRAARTRGEYWNNITPVSLAIGALTLIYIAASYLGRPAFRLTVICALSAVFIPVLPVFPPGILLTYFYRRLSWDSRKLRANYDLALYGILPGSSQKLAKYFALRAYTLELFAWALMFAGICINIGFICLFMYLFRIISF